MTLDWIFLIIFLASLTALLFYKIFYKTLSWDPKTGIVVTLILSIILSGTGCLLSHSMMENSTGDFWIKQYYRKAERHTRRAEIRNQKLHELSGDKSAVTEGHPDSVRLKTFCDLAALDNARNVTFNVNLIKKDEGVTIGDFTKFRYALEFVEKYDFKDEDIRLTIFKDSIDGRQHVFVPVMKRDHDF